MQHEYIGGFQILLGVLGQFWPVWLCLAVVIGGSYHFRKRLGLYGDLFATGVGIAGVNWDVRIIPLKFMGPDGGTTDAAVRAIDYIVDLKIRHGLNIVAINASWGSQGFSQILLEAIARAAREDILLVAAAGNGGPDDVGDDNDQMPEYPASYDPTPFAGWDSVISVAATGQWDDLPSFSNFAGRPAKCTLSTSNPTASSSISVASGSTRRIRRVASPWTLFFSKSSVRSHAKCSIAKGRSRSK